MRIKRMTACMAAACFLLWGAGLQAQETKNLKIASYNIRHGVGMDMKEDYARTARVIASFHADVVAVQEVDSATQRSGGKYVLGELAALTDMHPLFAPAIPFEGGKYGVGLLSRHKPLRHYSVPLPGREEERVLLVAEFADYVVGCTHLSLTEADRMASFDILRRVAGTVSKPFFLAGDLNAAPGSEFIQGLQKQFTVLTDLKKPTCPADKPKEAIDYILMATRDTAGVVPLFKGVADEPVASDHRPVYAEVAFKQEADKIFRMKPYLQNPTKGGITVMWQTTVPTYSWVEYGTDKEHLKRARTLVDGQVVCNGLENKIRLDSLEKGKTYYYRVCSREMLLYQAYRKEFGHTAVSDFYTFRLPDDGDTDFTAVIFNDLHQNRETLHALHVQVKDRPYDFVVFNGDCISDPRDENQATVFLKEMMETVGAERVPAFVIRGNHEIRNAFSIGLRRLLDYVDDKTYNAFSWGDTRFVTLDCGEDKPDSTWVYYGLNDFSGLRQAQVGFLREELHSKAFKKAAKRVLIHHIPIYGLSYSYNPCRDAWGKLLEGAPFNVSLNAHTHVYAYHPAGELGNTYPVVIGGGPEVRKSTVMILQKKGKAMTLKVLNAKGDTLLDLPL